LQGDLLAAELTVEQGSTTPDELSFLKALVAETTHLAGPIIEIGSLFGFTTIELALAKQKDKKLIAVDYFIWNPWGLNPTEHRKLAERVLRVAGVHLSVELVAADKNEFYKVYDGSAPSLVFLDAIHSYEETRKDIEWALKVGCRHIAGHDYKPEFPGVVGAVDAYGRPEVHGSVWVLRRD
jgi:predicted O-methyltransferase YrrM